MLTVHAHMILPCLPERALRAFVQSSDTMAWWQGCTTYMHEPSAKLCWQWRDAATSYWQYLTEARIKQWVPGVFLELDQVWQFSPNETEPLGPTRLLIEATPQVHETMLVVQHMDFKTGDERWTRYHAAVASGWPIALSALRHHLGQITTPWQ